MLNSIIQGNHDSYKILSILGRGSQGQVCLVQNLQGNNIQRFALKISGFLKEGEQLFMHYYFQNLHQEDLLLKHFDYFQNKNLHYVVQEFCSGGNLYEYISKNKINHLEVKSIIIQITNQLKVLHDLNLVHRDIKPENILIQIDQMNDTKKFKLCDFGEIREVSKQRLQTIGVGTPYYQAPEILETSDYDQSIDIWSLGAMIYELYTGNPLFNGATLFDIQNQIKQYVQNQTQIYQLIDNLQIQEKFKICIKNCLEVDSKKRPTLSHIQDIFSSRNSVSFSQIKIQKQNIEQQLPQQNVINPQQDNQIIPQEENKIEQKQINQFQPNQIQQEIKPFPFMQNNQFNNQFQFQKNINFPNNFFVGQNNFKPQNLNTQAFNQNQNKFINQFPNFPGKNNFIQQQPPQAALFQNATTQLAENFQQVQSQQQQQKSQQQQYQFQQFQQQQQQQQNLNNQQFNFQNSNILNNIQTKAQFDNFNKSLQPQPQPFQQGNVVPQIKFVQQINPQPSQNLQQQKGNQVLFSFNQNFQQKTPQQNQISNQNTFNNFKNQSEFQNIQSIQTQVNNQQEPQMKIIQKLENQSQNQIIQQQIESQNFIVQSQIEPQEIQQAVPIQQPTPKSGKIKILGPYDEEKAKVEKQIQVDKVIQVDNQELNTIPKKNAENIFIPLSEQIIFKENFEKKQIQGDEKMINTNFESQQNILSLFEQKQINQQKPEEVQVTTNQISQRENSIDIQQILQSKFNFVLNPIENIDSKENFQKNKNQIISDISKQLFDKFKANLNKK